MTVTNEFAAAIKQKREALGWSKAKLGRETGLNYNSIANIEAGKTGSGDSYDRIFKAMNMRVKIFF